MTMSLDDVIRTARKAYKLGLTPIPPREDGSKAPMTERVSRERLIQLVGPELAEHIAGDEPYANTWKHWQYTRPHPDTMKTLFANGHRRSGVGLLTGRRLEAFEFDCRETYNTFKETAKAGGLGDLIDRIEAGYLEETPGGGIHWLYFCDTIGGSTKLASRPDPDKPNKIQTLIETKGEGGFIVIAPSFGKVHKSGKPYRLLSGGLESIVEITPDERQELHLLGQAFNESNIVEYEVSVNVPPVAENSPGNDFIRKTTWPEILEPRGWKLIYRRGDTEFWRRPDKTWGISATINGKGITPDRFYVFSESTELSAGRSYTRFQAYTFLEHNGDFSASAKELSRQGYGEQNEGIRLLRSVFERDESDDDDENEDETDDDSEPEHPRFRIYHAQEIKDREPPPQLIRGVLIERSHAALFGNPGTFKSFVALDIASRIANGGLWCGYPVEHGPTLYTTGEGQASFGNRVRAWEIAREETNNTWILPEAVQFPQLADVEALLKAIDYYLYEQPRLIIIDTLARSSVGMDENSAEDMNVFVAGVDRVIREFGCSVLTVHHANRQGFYRGSSALLGAWDTVMETKKDDGGTVTVSCVKQKDLSEFVPINLRPEPVTLKEGKGLTPPLTSIVMQEESSGILTGAAKTALQILNTFPDGTYNQPWEDAAVSQGISRSHFFRCKKQLMELGLIETKAGVYYAIGKGSK